MIDPDDGNTRRAVFGKQVEQFLDSDVGRHILNKAKATMLEYTDKLKIADPANEKEIRSIQNEIWKAESIIDWLRDAILAGEEAMDIINEEHYGKTKG